MIAKIVPISSLNRVWPLQPTRSSWLWLNFKIGALSVGAASRLMLFEEAVVASERWMSPEEFQEVLTLAQMLPGPNLINLSASLGIRLCTPLTTALGLIVLAAPGSLLAVLVFLWVPLENPHVMVLFRGFAIGAFLLTGRFLWNLARGMPTRAASATSAQKRRGFGRYGIAALLAAGVFYGLPLLQLIAAGALGCLAWEFLT